MRLKLREIPGAYIGRHCEVVGPLGQRVYPPTPDPFRHPSTGVSVTLGGNRGQCQAFIDGYRFARSEATP